MIRSKDEDCVPYVGSTTKQYLSQRMDTHRNGYKRWKKGKYKFISVFELFEKYGVKNCYIELLESCSCKISEELLKKEREWFDKLNCVNIVRPFTTKEEKVEQMKNWYEANKEQVSERGKIYRDEHKEELVEKKKDYAQINKEKISEKSKLWRKENKEILAENKKEWYEANREQILEKMKEKYECPCGLICLKCNKARHEKSKKHQNYLTAIGTLCTTAVTESP